MAEIDQHYYPTLKFRWGAHDSQKWDMPVELIESVYGQQILVQAAAIVQQPRTINGRQVAFPASFTVTHDDGRTEAWQP